MHLTIDGRDYVVLSHPGTVSDRVKERIRSDMETLCGCRVLLLEEGMTLQGAIRPAAADAPEFEQTMYEPEEA